VAASWGRILRRRKGVRIDWLHANWSVFAVLFVIQFWVVRRRSHVLVNRSSRVPDGEGGKRRNRFSRNGLADLLRLGRRPSATRHA
jgi:hypothetical protein